MILALDNQAFVHYVHLQRGSVAVKVGRRIRRGDVVGKLGNSGNTNAPHLHFNVTDGPSPETAQGVPYVFDGFDVAGMTTADQVLGVKASNPPPATAVRRQRALPLDDAIVQFP